MARIRIGDLCQSQNALRDGTVIVSSSDFLDALFELQADDFVMVTQRFRPAVLPVGLASMLRVLKRSVSDPVSVCQVIVASGRMSGQIGYMPDFWLRVVVPAPL